MASRKELTAPPVRPLIGINTDYLAAKNATPYLRLNAGYVDAILAGGGLPVLLPPLRKDNLAEIDSLLDTVAGVILTGGADMDPRRNGQAMTAAVNPMPVRREDADRYLLGRIFERRTPVLGIGLGMQQLNVFAGGTLHLHLPVDNPKAMPHLDQTGAPHRHMVLIEPNTRLDEIYGTQELRVNSLHHQAVNQMGKKMRVAAKAPDGVIEAIESTDPSWFCVGVQWHPEADTASALDGQIFECFIQAAVRSVSVERRFLAAA
jgi:putative glutamine amidotransferase